MPIAANLSMMFTEFAAADRFAAARDAGFDAVEIQFPDEGDLTALGRARQRADMPVILVNVPRGGLDMAGLAALPGREADFRAALDRACQSVDALGARKVNVLAGLTPGLDPVQCRATLIDNLRRAGDVMQPLGIKVMVEPVNPYDVPDFFLTGLAPALDVLRDADHPNLALQFDFYHMARTEADLVEAIHQAGATIGHVQFADTNGRAQPGTGTIDFAAALKALGETPYRDVIAAEYRPPDGTATAETLGWMDDFRKDLAAWPK